MKNAEGGEIMADVILLKDRKTVWNVFDHEDFCELLREYLGDDAEQYFRNATNPDVLGNELFKLGNELFKLGDDELLKRGYCSGECQRVQETQESLENVLKDCDELAMEAYNKIMEDYQPGGRRTRKEQFALDKVIEIHRLVELNT